MRACVLLFLGCMVTIHPAFSQNKLALIVAVGQYPANSRVRPIAAVTDIKYIKAALRKNGFSEKNMDTLINAKATKAGILNSLASLAKKARKDDIVVISFGCHGQQIRDQKTIALGKDEDDGYDEALIPYDAKGMYSPTGYRGGKHLRDDELLPKLTEIRKKIGKGGSLLVLLDACHSGTGTRADDFPTSRGEPVPFPDPENPYDPTDISDTDVKKSFFDNLTDSISNMVVISGSGPHQENKQMLVNKEEVGSLSYGFYKAINDIPAGNDYNVLFQKIKATIQAIIPDQLPLIEGNTSQLLFSGKYLPKEERNFIRVGLKEGPRTGEDSIFIFNKGMMDNISEGATGRLYLAGKNEPVADALIRKAEHFTSIGIASRLLKRSESYELRFSEENYGSLSALFKFSKQGSTPALLEKQIKDFLLPYKFIRFDNNADFQFGVAESAEGKKISLVDRNNNLVWSAQLSQIDTLAAGDRNSLIAGIKNSLRIKYLRTIPDGGELTKWVSAEIIPAVSSDEKDAVMLKAGDKYSLKIKNNGPQKLFYTVLDIYPDNKVEVLYPFAGKEPADYAVEKNNFVERKLAVSPNSPPGVEFLKVIVSREPLDLRSVFEHTVRRDEMRSFQAMLDDLFNDNENNTGTRAEISSINAEEIGIITVNFIIK